jgi:hypothetical protein
VLSGCSPITSNQNSINGLLVFSYDLLLNLEIYLEMSTVKLYLLVPHHDIPADGPLVLGSIISDLRDPESLNGRALVYIPQEDIQTSHKYDVQDTTESAGGGYVGVCARFLSAVFGGSLGANYDGKSVINYRIPDLETTYFTPSQSYIEKAVNKHKVRIYLECASFPPVYMVIGLKISRGPGMQITSTNSYGGEGHGRTGLSATVDGHLVTIDSGDLAIRRSGFKERSIGGSSDVVLAYRLAKITFHKNNDGSRFLKYEKYTVGALWGEEDETPKRDGKIDIEVQFDGEVAVLEELQEEDLVTAIDEEDKEECRCFVVPPAEHGSS